jgi:hypothetical protein
MKFRHAAALALVGWYLMVPDSAHGSRPGCDEQTEVRADAEADTLKSWQAIHDSFLRYRLCDEGSIAEGYANSVVMMLVERWDQLPSLQTLIVQDDSFHKFIFRHIDATSSPQQLATIAKNAKHRCPKGLVKLCADIRRKALEAEAETDDPRLTGKIE